MEKMSKRIAVSATLLIEKLVGFSRSSSLTEQKQRRLKKKRKKLAVLKGSDLHVEERAVKKKEMGRR